MAGAAGKVVGDAPQAAAGIEHGCRLITTRPELGWNTAGTVRAQFRTAKAGHPVLTPSPMVFAISRFGGHGNQMLGTREMLRSTGSGSPRLHVDAGF